MKKIISVAALAVAGLALASPAQADNGDNFGGGVNAANNWNFTADAVCHQELAVVPVGGAWNGNTTGHCTHGNVLNPQH
ncbi:hypothetical protein [Streptomyces sp. NPDC006691]|uniref:hypothetical protein n=1 Tax=Streptomyces sp. NPDC006691 TaxID=3364757 RepID=UPI0036C9A193